MPLTRSAYNREDNPPDPGGLISGGPPPATTADEGPAPLGGMPREYRAAVPFSSQGHTETIAVAPRYYDGDEWRPANIGSTGIKALQRAMATAGLLNDDFRWGRWTQESAKAYAQVLGYANARGITDQMALSELINSPQIPIGGGGGGGTGGGGTGGTGGGGRGLVGFDENGEPIYGGYVAPPLEIKTTNPDDLRAIMRKAIIDIKGEGWSQDQINELVDAYNWQEIRVQKEAYDQQVALQRAQFEGGDAAIAGSTTIQPTLASPETFVENELRRRDPVGTQAGQVVNQALPAFMDMIGRWGGGGARA